jgi:hypothetical protein
MKMRSCMGGPYRPCFARGASWQTGAVVTRIATPSRRLLLGAAPLVALAATVGAAWWTKARPLTDGGWQEGEQYRRYAYTDLAALWYQRGLAEGAVPYVDAALEYPVLVGAQFRAVAVAAERFPEPPVFWFVTIHAVLAFGWALGTFLLLRRAGLGARTWWWVLSPQLLLHGLVNVDVAVAFWATAGIVAHRSRHPALAGAALAAGTATKLAPALLVPVLLLDHLRAPPGERLAPAARLLGSAAAVWLALNLPVLLVAPEGWAGFFRLSRERGAQAASLWAVVGWAADAPIATGAMNTGGALLFGGGAALLLVGAWRRPAPVWPVALPVVAWFLLTNKVYSPQFSLWVVPLALLAVPPGRLAVPLGAFAAADAAVYLTELSHLGVRAGYGPGASYGLQAACVVARAVALAWLASTVLRGGWRDPAARSPTWSDDEAKPRALVGER